MLVKSLKVANHTEHLEKTFDIFRRYRMKLNQLECTFGVASGKFLGYMVNQHKIKANPNKIKALLSMRSPNKPKEVKSLIGQHATLSLLPMKNGQVLQRKDKEKVTPQGQPCLEKGLLFF